MEKFDAMGNDLNIGDKVAYSISLNTDIHIGEIVRFTKKLVYLKSNTGYTAQRTPNKLIKIKL